MRFIGDVHGKMGQYLAITDLCDASVQVGDFGAGFVPLPEIGLNHRFIRGNHDSPAVCRSSPNWISDGTVETINGTRILYIGGAWSVDWQFRRPGISWWPDEECSWSTLYDCLDAVSLHKPNIIVSHDCPRVVCADLFGPHTHHYETTRTSSALDAMLAKHSPDLWIFGHHHSSVKKRIGLTEFVCLDELAYVDLLL